MGSSNIPILKNLETGGDIHWNISSHPFLMLTGSTGTGKSTFLLQLIALIYLYSDGEAKIILLDYKHSDDFLFARSYDSYYAFENVTQGFDRFYQEFRKRLSGESDDYSQWWLVFDEYSSWISMLDKKTSEEYKNKLGEILRLSRSLNMRGIFVLQRADSIYFMGGIRDNFSVKIGLGRLSQEAKKMLFDTDLEIKPQKIGKGYIQIDGYEIKPCLVPKVRNRQKMIDCIKAFLARLADIDEDAAPP
ncbi:FtsK/SpoIIIE domain-containing protein [Streptococcus pneumoniae]